jgi:HPt (histidine-containing phosphotransfer) domain-containing protein
MDLQMPVLDGHDAFRLIVGALGEKRPRIVALTAGSLADVSGDVDYIAMDGLMNKPFDVDELVERMRSLVDGQAAPAPCKALELAADWPEIPGVDSGLARSLMGDNQALFLKALRIFARQYDDLDAVVAANDLSDAKRTMHRLKGSAAVLGAQTLRDLALQAEAACNQRDAHASAVALRRVSEAFNALREGVWDLDAEREKAA